MPTRPCFSAFPARSITLDETSPYHIVHPSLIIPAELNGQSEEGSHLLTRFRGSRVLPGEEEVPERSVRLDRR